MKAKWEGIPPAQVEPQAIALSKIEGGIGKWKILSTPWWLKAKREEDRLILIPKNCGHHRGLVRLKADGARIYLAVSSTIPVSFSLFIRRAIQSLISVYVAVGFLVLILYFLLEKFGWAPVYHLPFSVWHYDISVWADDLLILGMSLGWGLWTGGWRFALRATIVTYVCAKTASLLGRAFFLRFPTLWFGFYYYGEGGTKGVILIPLLLVIIGLLWGFLMGGRVWLALRSAIAGTVAGLLGMLVVRLLQFAGLPRPPSGTDVFPSINQMFWWSVAGLAVTGMVYGGVVGGFLARMSFPRREKTDEESRKIPDLPETSVNRVAISPLEVRWENMPSDLSSEKEIAISEAGEQPSKLKVSKCPWWLEARTEAKRLVLRVKHCGTHDGYVWTRIREGQVGIPVSSSIFAEKSLWILGFYKGIVVAMVGLFTGFLLNQLFARELYYAPFIPYRYQFDRLQTTIHYWLFPVLHRSLAITEIPIDIRAMFLLVGTVVGGIWGGLTGGRKMVVRSALGGLVSGYIIFWGTTLFLMPQGWLFSAREFSEFRISTLLFGGVIMGFAGDVWGRFISGWKFSRRVAFLWGLSAIAGLLIGNIGFYFAKITLNMESYTHFYGLVIPILAAVLLAGGLVGATIARIPQKSL